MSKNKKQCFRRTSLTTFMGVVSAGIALGGGITLTASCSIPKKVNINPSIKQSRDIKFYAERNAIQDMLADAREKAKDTSSGLIYSISWPAVLHRYGALFHMLEVLSLNPQKEIWVYGKDSDSSNEFNRQFIQPILNRSDLYPNFHYVEPHFTPYDTLTYPAGADIVSRIEDFSSRGLVTDFYCDDYRLLKPLTAFMAIDRTDVASRETASRMIYASYGFLSKARSVNMIADGTASWGLFYNGDIWTQMQLAGMDYDEESGTFPLAVEWRKRLFAVTDYSADSDSFTRLFGDDKDAGAKIILALTSGFSVDEYGHVSSKYFVPGTETVCDLNTTGDISKPYRDKGFFDPYYTVSADMMNLYESMDPDARQLALQSLGVSLLDNPDNLLGKNTTTVVYSCGLTAESEAAMNQVVDQVVKIYKRQKSLMEDDGSNSTQRLQVLLKRHPRDWNTEQDVKDALLSRYAGDADVGDASWLHFMDQKTPMELNVLNGMTTSVPEIGRKVIYWCSYSTIVYFLRAAGQDTPLTIVDDVAKDHVREWNGYPSNVFQDGSLFDIDLNPTEL